MATVVPPVLNATPLSADESGVHGREDQRTPLVVRVSGLSKRFRARRTMREITASPFRLGPLVGGVQDVTLDVRRGEFFGLLGPNGAGKTTLFKLLCASVYPDAGTIEVDGVDVVRRPRDVRRVITPVLASDRSLNWRLSARENLRMYAALYGLSGEESRRKVDDVLASVGLMDAADRMLGTFSSGMAQRVSLARAFLADPKVLLLDEPTRSLDPVSARDFRDFLRRDVAGLRGCTILLATHSPEEAFDLCDRVAVMDRGRVLATGPSSTLLDRFGDEIYRVWTTAPAHAAFTSPELARVATLRRVQPAEGSEWAFVELDVPGGPEAAQQALTQLVLAGVPVSRFERSSLSLADLLERIVRASAPITEVQP